MNGLELSRAYYEEYGKPMIDELFPDKRDRMAIGLVGHGSECFGYDDDISRDHDYEPCFCIWLTDEDEENFGFKLFRAYSKLPKEFGGVSLMEKSLLGSGTKGVHTISEFYSFYTGHPGAPRTTAEWLAIPSFYLAEATNGEVFEDHLGEFTRIRNEIKFGMPEDVRLKKLASSIFGMAQCGQYSYSRCLSHGENGAAVLAVTDFAKHTAEAAFLICHEHAPYYKWLFKAMRSLPVLCELADTLDEILASPLDKKKNAPLIESVSSSVARCLRETSLADCNDEYLEKYSYEIIERIKDPSLRNSPIML